MVASIMQLLRLCRTSHEVRGLKSEKRLNKRITFLGRTSHEVRGLKYPVHWLSCQLLLSHLTRGAWIEIYPI